MAEVPSPSTEKETLRVQVAGAHDPDVGKGVARLSAETFAELGITPGTIIQIDGKRSAPVVALPAHPSDQGLPIIRLDGLVRSNAGVGIGDHVEIAAADVRPATRVVLAPAQKNVRLQGSGEALLRTLVGRPLSTGDVVSTSVYQQTSVAGLPPELAAQLFGQQRSFGLQEIRLIVTSTTPRGIVQITEQTEIELLPEYEEPHEGMAPGVTYDDVGGLSDTLEQVREMIELPLKHPELFSRLGIDPPKGVLLYGPPGTGKTLLARAVANESDAHFLVINGPEIMGRYYGESEERLRAVFEEATENEPAIIFIDEIDSIAPKRGETGETERRIVAQLLTLMDGLDARGNVVVIAATNRAEDIDEALRRPGRFDREITAGVPDTAGRREILTIHTRGMPLNESVSLEELARTTYGFVGADLAALAREAAISALRRNLPGIDLDQPEIPQEILEKLIVTQDDFQDAQRRVQPSALREIQIEVPQTRWDDIGGLDDIKRELQEGIELPLKNPDAFRTLGIRQPKGFLLYGPPGNGKTLLAKAVARESEANFISTRSSDLLSKWYGESEQQIAKLFQRARQVAPTVIFIDEIDALAPSRGGSLGEPAVTERVVNTILAEMDGLEELQGVVVIGATNRPTLLDPALLRPGRFDEIVYVPVPDEAGRLKILQVQTEEMPLGDDVSLETLAEQTERYSGADLQNLVRQAGMLALREGLTDGELTQEKAIVPMRYFEQALEAAHPSLTPEVEREYERMREILKQDNPTDRRIGFSLTETESE